MLKFVDKTGRTVATLSDEDAEPQFSELLEKKESEDVEILGDGEADSPSAETPSANSKV